MHNFMNPVSWICIVILCSAESMKFNANASNGFRSAALSFQNYADRLIAGQLPLLPIECQSMWNDTASIPGVFSRIWKEEVPTLKDMIPPRDAPNKKVKRKESR